MANIKYSTNLRSFLSVIGEKLQMKIMLHTVSCTPLGAVIVHLPNMVKFNYSNFDNTGGKSPIIISIKIWIKL